MQYQALRWLYKQLREKRIALGRAEKKPNHTEEEIKNILSTIEIIEYIIGIVNAKGEE